MADTSEETSRLTAEEIFEAAIDVARDELERTNTALAFSGVLGGFVMGLTALGVALVRHFLGDSEPAKLASFVAYPAGFIGVIIGRAQLFTENTVYPVLLAMRERSRLGSVARLWTVVLVGNVAGALLFAALAVWTPAFSSELHGELIKLGLDAGNRGSAQVFWSAIFGGWLIAMVAWTVTASHWTIGHVVMVWMLTFLVGAAELAHSIAGSVEVLSAVVAGKLPVLGYARWMALALVGNVLGGVFFVSLLNYGQVRGGKG